MTVFNVTDDLATRTHLELARCPMEPCDALATALFLLAARQPRVVVPCQRRCHAVVLRGSSNAGSVSAASDGGVASRALHRRAVVSVVSRVAKASAVAAKAGARAVVGTTSAGAVEAYEPAMALATVGETGPVP